MNSSRILNNEYGLAEMQENLLQALDTIDEICRKNSIYYAIHGGTMLGAERNGHLIPWDDDVDISMKRTEFEKLKRVINKGDIPDNYYLDEQTMWFPRFVMKKKEAPVYIDILIWDYITENKLGRFLKINLLRAIQGMMKEEVDYSRFDIKGKVLLFITQSVGKLMSNNKKLQLFHFIETKLFLGHKQYIHRSNDSYKGVSYILDKDYMDGYQEIELEGKKYFVNSRYREFLVMEYGENYMTPPPISERHPGHTQFRNSIKKKQEAEVN